MHPIIPPILNEKSIILSTLESFINSYSGLGRIASRGGRNMKRIITGREVPVPNELENILEPDEIVFHSFEQASITGKFGGAHSIYITNRRVAKLVPSAFGLRKLC